MKLSLFIILLFISYAKIIYSNSIFDSEFYHVEIFTVNASETKLKEINKIKIKTFEKIVDKIINSNDRNIFLKKINYKYDLDKIIRNIIIENEIITDSKYIADIKVNYDNKELIYFIRNNKINYSDISTNPFLIISSYTEKFLESGLDNKNQFYNKLNSDFKNEKLIKFEFPELNPNDRYLLSYKDIIEINKKSIIKISNKYNSNDIFLIKINSNNEYYDTEIYVFFKESNTLSFVKNISLLNDKFYHEKIFKLLNDWWININLINNNVNNEIICKIEFSSYLELINIKTKIKNLSQFKSIELLTIAYNHNIEKIEFYGGLDIFKKSLIFNNIKILNEQNCIIKNS